MYCIECGQAQPLREAQFCPFCGMALLRAQTSAAVPSPAQALPEWPVASEGGTACPSEQSPPVAAALAPSIPGYALAAANPLGLPTASMLDPARWVPLRDRREQLRSRMRWAIRAAIMLLLALAGAGAWWWANQPDPAPSDEGIEVERIETPADPGKR